MNQVESAGMWKIYAPNGDSIVIKSTYGKLRRYFKPAHIVFDAQSRDTELPCPMTLTEVKYIDKLLEESTISEGHSDYPFMYKHISYEHEREFRIFSNLAYLSDNYDSNKSNEIEKRVIDHLRENKGLYLAVDVKDLIQEIYVAPRADKWFIDLVRSTARRCGLSEEIVKPSTLIPNIKCNEEKLSAR
jgi:hypothetical protein